MHGVERMNYVIQNAGSRQVVHNVIDMLDSRKAWAVEIKPWQPKRSHDQNSKYWSIVEEIARQTGHHKDEIHDILKVKFLQTKTVNIFGIEREVVPDSRNLSASQFSEYIDQVQAWAATDLGIHVH